MDDHCPDREARVNPRSPSSNAVELLRAMAAWELAFHAIGELVIEGIVFHEEEGRLQILIGS